VGDLREPPVAPVPRSAGGDGELRRPQRTIREAADAEHREAALDEAVNGLRRRSPSYSAFTTFTRRQLLTMGALVVVAIAGSFYNVKDVAILFVACCALGYLGAIIFRLRLLLLSVDGLALVRISDAEALAVPPTDLPHYTVIVPAYHEPAVVERLIHSVGAVDYPKELLDIKLLLEEDDEDTVHAAMAATGVENFELILVPPAQPRTKPKALNYGLQYATGDLLTIFDAEDRPDPLQLRKAAVALARAGPEVACIQAQLAYFNSTQNIITRWFTVEYLMWFRQMLPGLAAIDAPVPLGGTSNHFRCDVLQELGGWDPFNVTEDADLGVRLHRLGYRTAILESVTYEEANSDFVNWARQRSRWYKGYMQTWLVHMRKPRELWRSLGTRGFIRFNMFVAGTPLIAVLNPLFWALTIIWFVGHPLGIRAIFPASVYYVGLACWLVGNFLFMYLNVIVVVDAGRDDLLIAAILSPVYWIMMSIAAVKAFYQLAATPSYWEKTFHGLDVAGNPPVTHAKD
jgi:cellulose synthase/poly-beta-1,6-N-acetylglucosamine synthase-like glycosyltransferase